MVENYYIIHDVDVNPIHLNSIKQYQEPTENFILKIYSHWETLGGTIKLKGSIFQKINGFPNNYWGWGHEDKDLNNHGFYDAEVKTFVTDTQTKIEINIFLEFKDVNDKIQIKHNPKVLLCYHYFKNYLLKNKNHIFIKMVYNKPLLKNSIYSKIK